MWVRVATVFATLVASSFAIVTGCLPEQERTSYGPAESLGPRKFPNPEPGNGTPPGGDGPADPNQLCNGQGPIDAGDCAVKWSDIFTKTIAANGTLKCGQGGCHNAGGTSPEISGDDAKKAWDQLTKYKMGNPKAKDKPYINPCSKDPVESAIGCNLDGKNSCDQMPPGSGAAADEYTKITQWVQCGAPNN